MGNDLDHSSIAVDSSVKAIGKCAVHVFIYLLQSMAFNLK